MNAQWLITSGQDPTLEEAERFRAGWAARLEHRLRWFEGEVAGRFALDGSTSSLDHAAAWVVGRVGLNVAVDDEPDWLTPGLVNHGWTAYGAALTEGLMAYVSAIYADHLGFASLPWIIERDPRSPYYLRPVVDAQAIAPPWRQVLGSLRVSRESGERPMLRSTVEHSLEHHRRLADEQEMRGLEDRHVEPWVEVTSVGSSEWQVSFPEDIVEMLRPSAYAELEDRLSAVDGVTEVIMEDRDRAIVYTANGVDAGELTTRLETAVASLAEAE
jgi:hypothetical protein